MRKIQTILFAGLASTMLFACKSDGGEEDKSKETDENQVEKETKENQKDEKQEELRLTVSMSAKSGSTAAGHINLKEMDGVVKMSVDMKGLAPGEHAIHIHENGDCSADDGTSAGGHWNPKGDDHGKWGKDAYHMGDIGNLVADEKGKVSYEFKTDKWCLECDDETKNIIGKSFIVHAGADDFKSQPSGAAGARVACGVIEK
jgi:Cu-Zn family superoxide dismutase